MTKEDLNGPQLRPPDVVQDMILLYAEARTKGITGVNAEPYKDTTPLFPHYSPIYQKVDAKAIISIENGLQYRGTLLDLATGPTMTEEVFRALAKAEADPDIETIYLWIDGMGFSAVDSGGFDLSEYIHSLRKPCISLCSRSALSGFFLLAAAARNGFYISGDMVRVGSIGVVIKYAVNPETPNVKHVTIAEGQFKAAGDPAAEQTPEVAIYQENRLQYVMRIFRERVQKYRKLSNEAVEKVANGKIFYGEEAIHSGLANGFFSLEKWIVEQQFIPILKQLKSPEITR